jgi:hypothetical protein
MMELLVLVLNRPLVPATAGRLVHALGHAGCRGADGGAGQGVRAIRSAPSSVFETEVGVALLPVGQLLFGSVAGQALAFLQLAQELLALAGDDVQIVVGELAPLLTDLAGELLPVALDAVFIHGLVLSVMVM